MQQVVQRPDVGWLGQRSELGGTRRGAPPGSPRPYTPDQEPAGWSSGCAARQYELRPDGFEEPVVRQVAAEAAGTRALVGDGAQRGELDADAEVIHEQSDLVRARAARRDAGQHVR